MGEDRRDEKACKSDNLSNKPDCNSDARCFQLVRDFCMGSGLDKDFEDFAKQHADVFDGLLTPGESAENKHEYHRIYQLYLEIFERKISDFIVSCNGTVQGFHSTCQRILDTMPEGSSDRFFVEAILSATDFEVFIALMRGEIRKIHWESQRK